MCNVVNVGSYGSRNVWYSYVKLNFKEATLNIIIALNGNVPKN